MQWWAGERSGRGLAPLVQSTPPWGSQQEVLKAWRNIPGFTGHILSCSRPWQKGPLSSPRVPTSLPGWCQASALAVLEVEASWQGSVKWLFTASCWRGASETLDSC